MIAYANEYLIIEPKNVNFIYLERWRRNKKNGEITIHFIYKF